MSLPPALLEVQGVGTLKVPFGEAPVVAVERFAREVRRAQSRPPLAPLEVQQVLNALCAQVPCHGQTTLEPVTLEVEGVGTCVVSVGQEPADAARQFLQEALQRGHAIDASGAEGLMRALCSRKPCAAALDLSPAQVTVAGVGVLAVPLGADPVAATEAFLERAREAGHAVGADDAETLLAAVCGLPSLRGACTRPLNVAPLQLEVWCCWVTFLLLLFAMRTVGTWRFAYRKSYIICTWPFSFYVNSVSCTRSMLHPP